MWPGYSRYRWAPRANPVHAAILGEVSPDRLRAYVDMLSFPRHYEAQRQANLHARDLLVKTLTTMGYTPALQGSYDNIVVTTGGQGPFLLLGAHYDSMPATPGADDNASAVAVCLEAAHLLKMHGDSETMVVLFNREEDGLLGSNEFVASLARGTIAETHVFEMVGFTSKAPNSQKLPHRLPRFVAPSVGDFLALLANRHSNAIANRLLALAASYLPGFSVVALKMYFGIEKKFRHFQRSDHTPFWNAGIPALMWTDTSEFRNPHYHQATDVPETLDYDFLAKVTKLTIARALNRS